MEDVPKADPVTTGFEVTRLLLAARSDEAEEEAENADEVDPEKDVESAAEEEDALAPFWTRSWWRVGNRSKMDH